MHEIASVLMEHGIEEKYVDVPLSLAHGKRKLPLGRYLRRKLRVLVGKSENTPDSELVRMREEMQPLLDHAKAITPKGAPGLVETNFKNAILEKSEGKRIQIENRQRRMRNKGEI